MVLDAGSDFQLRRTLFLIQTYAKFFHKWDWRDLLQGAHSDMMKVIGKNEAIVIQKLVFFFLSMAGKSDDLQGCYCSANRRRFELVLQLVRLVL